MHSFLDSKIMAKALRTALAERRIDIGHSDALELVARQFGFANWNMLAARIEAAQLPPLDLPDGWVVTGQTKTADYRLGLDPATPGAALIESRPGREAAIDGSGGEPAGLMQSAVADAWRGRRLRLSAQLRTEAAGTGTIWLRIDGAPGKVLRFDNMMQRQGDGALTGDSGWVERTIVLEVPDEAISVHYGVFLIGSGKVWARGFRLEPVDAAVATTEQHPRLHERPVNLDFSARRQPPRPAA